MREVTKLPTIPKFKAVTEPGPDRCCFIITEGEFEGYKFQYGVVSVDEAVDGEDTVPIHFDYDVLNRDNLLDDAKIRFEDILASILVHLIETQAKDVIEETEKS